MLLPGAHPVLSVGLNELLLLLNANFSPNVLTILLEYIELFNLSGNIKETFGRGALLLTTLYHYILF